MGTIRVAAVQATPVWMDRGATVERTVELIGEAAANGAGLIVFPEAFVPGEPYWKDTQRPWEEPDEWHARLLDQCVVVPSEATDRIGTAAAEAGAYVVTGIQERDPNGGTVYCSLVYHSSDGALLGTHRKLMPTGSERLVWGQGDGSTLEVFDTSFGRLGGLICWENYMPLARFYLYSQRPDVWVAPTLALGDAWVATMRHIAREGRVWVIGANPVMRYDDVPEDFPHRERLGTHPEDDEWVAPGNTVIVSPSGAIVEGPLRHEEGILYADLDIDAARAERRFFDPVGHYNRPDIFRLSVDVTPRPAVEVVTSIDPEET